MERMFIMNIYDQHVHTKFSPDSNEEIDEYLKIAKKNGDKYFITTEHLDLNSNYYHHENVIPNFKALKKELKNKGEKYGVKTLFGVECGFRKDLKEKIDNVLNSQKFDLILLSVHDSRTMDVSSPKFYKNKSDEDAYNEYLDLVLDAVTYQDNFDVLAHIDFVLRYVSEKMFLDDFSDKLRKIFKILIKKDKALELNTRLISRYNTLYYTDFILSLYLEEGGTKLTLSSDSHRVGDLKNHFNRVIPLLKKKGVTELYFYKKRKPFTIKI